MSDDWIYEKEQLLETPSIKDGIPLKAERQYRQEGVRFIMNCGAQMGVGHITIATGVVYFHRFYMLQSFKVYSHYVTACSCLFLAGKSEETPKRSRDIIEVARTILPGNYFSLFGEDPKKELLTMESILLHTIKFDICVYHPYPFVIKYALSIKGDKRKLHKVVQTAWNFVNDSLSTTLCLEWEPEIIAIAMLRLACKIRKFIVTDWKDRQSTHKCWWELFVLELDDDILEEICHQVLDVYESTEDKSSAQKPETVPTDSTDNPESEAPCCSTSLAAKQKSPTLEASSAPPSQMDFCDTYPDNAPFKKPPTPPPQPPPPTPWAPPLPPTPPPPPTPKPPPPPPTPWAPTLPPKPAPPPTPKPPPPPTTPPNTPAPSPPPTPTQPTTEPAPLLQSLQPASPRPLPTQSPPAAPPPPPPPPPPPLPLPIRTQTPNRLSSGVPPPPLAPLKLYGAPGRVSLPPAPPSSYTYPSQPSFDAVPPSLPSVSRPFRATPSPPPALSFSDPPQPSCSVLRPPPSSAHRPYYAPAPPSPPPPFTNSWSRSSSAIRPPLPSAHRSYHVAPPPPLPPSFTYSSEPSYDFVPPPRTLPGPRNVGQWDFPPPTSHSRYGARGRRPRSYYKRQE